MALPKFTKSEGGFLDGIKSRMGFSDSNHEYDDRRYGQGRDAFDDYDDDYDDYGDDYADDGNPAPGSNYDPYSSVTTRPAGGSTRARSASGFTPPKLVSIDEVRAHTAVPDSLNRDPLPPRRTSAARRGDRTMVEPSYTAPANTPNGRAAAASNKERSESLNALFSSTDSASDAPVEAAAAAPASASASAAPAAPKRAAATSPYATLTSSASAQAPSVQGAVRSIAVVKPSAYADVEKVVKALKAGNVVVLSLANTPDALAKRILDFSFGASSALDARVDCEADKVFVIARGAALMDSERTSLRNQGVL